MIHNLEKLANTDETNDLTETPSANEQDDERDPNHLLRHLQQIRRSGHTRSYRNLHFEDNNHEEADTLMICLAAKVSQRCPDALLVFFTPDTDVLVLAVVNYDNSTKGSHFR
jgi:hypothetical protein